MMRRCRVLFVMKHREDYWGSDGNDLSSGLRNSVRFVVDMLNGLGVAAKVVELPDNNAIDREVTAFKPTHCIAEAFWVVPAKFDALMPLHPEVQWLVRNHSELPFLANEGIAVEWTGEYLKRGIEIMCNSPRALAELRDLAAAARFRESMISLGPNFYPIPGPASGRSHPAGRFLDVGCFGAIRPLKNHLVQAVAAISAATDTGQRLRFHINSSRVEGGGGPILKNLRALFAQTPRHDLVEHGWVPHKQFLPLMATMDVALQVSFSETFNIVAADAVAMGVPVIASSEVPWLGPYAHANPNYAGSITRAMTDLWGSNLNHRLAEQRRDLMRFCMASEHTWGARFGAAPPIPAPPFPIV